MKFRDKHIRVDRKFDEELKRIVKLRLREGFDDRPQSTRRLTLAITRHRLFPDIEKDIINADLKEK